MQSPPHNHSQLPGASSRDAAEWFFHHSDEGFALARDGRLVSVNPAWCAITRSRPLVEVGRPLSELFLPSDEHRYLHVLGRLEADGVAEVEHRLPCTLGGYVWVRMSIKRGEGDYAILILQDISARMAAADARLAARRSVELLRTAAGVRMWSFDPATGAFANDSDELRLTTSDTADERDLSLTTFKTLVHPDDLEAVISTFEISLHTGAPAEVWYRRRTRSGSWLQLRASWRGVRPDEQGRWHMVGLTQDMTELSNARDMALIGERVARDATEIKSQFLANISHEIRTPLNGVLGVLHLLHREPLSSEGQALLKDAIGCGEMLSELLKDVLDFSRIEAGFVELKPEPTDPVQLLTSVIKMMRPLAEQKGLRLSAEVATDGGDVLIDPVRVRQVLLNLIGNALKFTQSGGVTVRLGHEGDGTERRLTAEVQDTGIGISEAAQTVLFDRFTQGDGSSTRQFGGAGLGLAITRALTSLMGGDVGCRSTVGQGSTFWINVAAPCAEHVAPKPVASEGLLDGLRILIVDDNRTNRIVAGKIVESLGATIDLAEDGITALEAVSTARYDVILMDVQMPVMDGLEATRRIRAGAGESAATPILAMTANVMSHQIAEYMSAGMDGVISKPLSPAAMIAEMSKLSGLTAPTDTVVADQVMQGLAL